MKEHIAVNVWQLIKMMLHQLCCQISASNCCSIQLWHLMQPMHKWRSAVLTPYFTILVENFPKRINHRCPSSAEHPRTFLEQKWLKMNPARDTDFKDFYLLTPIPVFFLIQGEDGEELPVDWKSETLQRKELLTFGTLLLPSLQDTV